MQRWDHAPEKPATCILRTESAGDFYHHADSGHWARKTNEPLQSHLAGLTFFNFHHFLIIFSIELLYSWTKSFLQTFLSFKNNF